MSGYSVYLDDAGHPNDKPYLVIGGFIAREDRWEDFEEPWKDILRKRRIDFPFHATDFFFEHRKDPKLKHVVTDLVRVITNHVEASFSITIEMEAYKEFNQKFRLEEMCGTPYAIITKSLHENVELWQKVVGPRSPLLYFVEDGTLHRGDMMDCLRDRDGINPPIPVPKAHIACQAADFYAYSVFQSAIQGGKPSLSYRCFQEKLQFPRERLDARIFRDNLEKYLSEPHTKLLGVEEKILIPSRAATEGMQFNFDGNPKKFRKARVGFPKR